MVNIGTTSTVATSPRFPPVTLNIVMSVYCFTMSLTFIQSLDLFFWCWMMTAIFLLADQVMEDKIAISFSNLFALFGMDTISVMFDNLLFRNNYFCEGPSESGIEAQCFTLSIKLLWFLNTIIMSHVVMPENSPFWVLDNMFACWGFSLGKSMISVGSLLALFCPDTLSIILNYMITMNHDLRIKYS